MRPTTNETRAGAVFEIPPWYAVGTERLTTDGDQEIAVLEDGQIVVINEPSIQALIAALGAEDDEVRRQAQMALNELGVEAVEPLGEALLHGAPEVRRRAAALLANFGDARVVEILLSALDRLQEERDALTLLTVVDALGNFGDPRAVKPLMGALDEADSNVRRRIIRTLVSIGDKRAVEAIEALVDDPQVGETARWALMQLGD